MKVLLLSRYSSLAASSRIRSFQYIPYLKSQGIEITVNALLDDNYLNNIYSTNTIQILPIIQAYLRRLAFLLKSRHYDLLWIEKELFPWLPSWTEQFLGMLKIPYIVDYDDAIFHSYDLNSSIFIRKVLGKKIDRVMNNAALVVVGNSYLAKRAKRAGAKRIKIVPTVVDLSRYNSRFNSKPNLNFTIGWIGTPKTVKYIFLIEKALRKVCSNSKVSLKLIGSGPVKIKGVNIEIIQWSEEREVLDINSFDVGIMPLYDRPWEHGKCGYKLIQYMACRKPVVASPVGINCDIVDHGETGYLASNNNEWINFLNNLIKDKNLRKQMGDSARKKIESTYSLQITEPLLFEIFNQINNERREGLYS